MGVKIVDIYLIFIAFFVKIGKGIRTGYALADRLRPCPQDSAVNAPSLPLKAYEDLKSFKLYLLDVGLLSCMVRLKQNTLLDGNELFKEFKGALTEQYVLQQLKTVKELETYYWTNDRGGAEIDFVVDNGST